MDESSDTAIQISYYDHGTQDTIEQPIVCSVEVTSDLSIDAVSQDESKSKVPILTNGTNHRDYIDAVSNEVDENLKESTVNNGTFQRGSIEVERGAVEAERGAIEAERGAVEAERGAVEAERGSIEIESNDEDDKSKVLPFNNGPIQKGVFKCFECIFSCPTTVELAAHYKIHRSKNPFRCFKCGYEGKDKEDFLEHSISHIESNYFKCSKCSFKTNTMKAIRSHVYSKHDKENVVCCVCHRKFSSELKREHHEKVCTRRNMHSDEDEYVEDNNVMKPKMYKKIRRESRPNVGSKFVSSLSDMKSDESVKLFTCSTCYFIFHSKSGLTEHDYNAHTKNWKIKKETKLFYSEKYLNNGSEEASFPNPYVKLEKLFACPYCYIIFLSEVEFNEHNGTHRLSTDCQLCGGSFITNSELQDHLAEAHSESPQFACINCGKLYATEVLLESHLKNEHSQKGNWACPFCPRLMKTEQGLKVHLEAHSKVKSLNCLECGYLAINPSELRKHSRKHIKPAFSCSICGIVYKREETLKKHMLRCNDYDIKSVETVSGHCIDLFEDMSQIEIDITQKEKLACSECGFIFNNHSQLKEHMLRHYQKNRYRCLKCNIQCSSQNSLDKHNWGHVEEAESTECWICQKEYITLQKLKRHLTTHTNERPYKCKLCDKTYKSKDTLLKHGITHRDERPYVCHLCPYASRRKDCLQKHVLVHGKQHNGLL